jgi:hypothetical protein
MALMIAQTMVEYGALPDSISSAFSKATYQLEHYIGTGNSKYVLIAGIVAIVLLLWPRRRPC